MSAIDDLNECETEAMYQKPEAAESLDGVFKAQHISQSAIAAGKTYRSFLNFLDSFFKSEKERARVEFVYPEILAERQRISVGLANVMSRVDEAVSEMAENGTPANALEMECLEEALTILRELEKEWKR